MPGNVGYHIIIADHMQEQIRQEKKIMVVASIKQEQRTP
jgi:hypothetical protein